MEQNTELHNLTCRPSRPIR